MQHDFPLTALLCDVIRMNMGKLTRQDLRAKWQNGSYRGVNPAYARWYVEG